MLTRLREGTPDAADEGRADAAQRRSPEATAAPIRIDGLGHSFGELRAIERIDLEAEPGEVVGIVGPSGCGKTTLLELVAGLRPADSGTHLGRRPDRSRASASTRCAYMPQRDLLLPWLSALDNAALALRIAGLPRARRRALAPREHFERLGLAGFERTPPGRALRRDAPAGRLPAHADGGAARPAARRAVRLARCDHAGGDAVLARRECSGPTGTRSCSSPTTSRRRSISPTACWCSARARLRVADRIEIPRPRAADRAAAVTSAEFAELQERRAAQPRGGGAMSGARRYLAPVAVILVLLGAWELAARWDWISNALNIEDFLVPAPSDIAKSLWEDRSLLADTPGSPSRRSCWASRSRPSPGIAFAVLLSPLRDRAARRLSAAGRIADDPDRGDLAPILVVWFGFGLDAEAGDRSR